MTSPEHGPAPATSEMDNQRKLMEEKERQILQSRMKTVTLAARNKVVNFLRKYILGKKPEDKQKVVDQGKEKEKKDKPEAESETETPDQIIDRQFTKIHEAQNMGKPLSEAQQQFISHVAAEAAVDPLAQKNLELEVPETDPKDPAAESPKKQKPTLATILPGAITPEMLLRYDFSDYEMAEEPGGQKILTLKSSPSVREKIEELAARKVEKPEESKPSSEKEYRRRIIPKSEVTLDMLADPEFQKMYETVTESGEIYYRKRGLEIKRIAGGADDDAEDARTHISHPPRSSDEERARAMNLGAGDPAHDMSEEELRDYYRKSQNDPEFQRQQFEKFLSRQNEQNEDDSGDESILLDPRGSRNRSRIPGVSSREGMDDEDVERSQVQSLVENTFFFPPKADDNESPQDYEKRMNEAKKEYYSAEASAMRLEQVRKRAIYLIETLSGASSEQEIHWIIEDTLRAGENDWVSPDTFQQAGQSVLQAIDTVFSTDQARRKKFSELIRGRLAGFACEFYARFVNAGKLGENITNFFQEYYQSMLDLPGVSRMMEIIEEKDDQEGTNIRGAYFRKLNYEENLAKKTEWYKYYKESERNDKDKRWGVWVVDKKFKLYREGLEDKRKFNSDYIDQFKDKGDEELVKVLLIKSHINHNNPVDAIKELHRVVFPEMYEGQDVELPKDYHLPAEILQQLHGNEKLKNAVRILSDNERKVRRSLKEDKVTLSQSTGIPLDRMIYEINRSVILSQRIEHSFQFSTHWDNIRWKKEENMSDEEKEIFRKALAEIEHVDPRHLDEYGINKQGGLIVLNPVVPWAIKSDPRYKGSNDKDKEKKHEQLKAETDPHKRQILEKELENLSGEKRMVNLRVAGEKRAELHRLKRQLKNMADGSDEKKNLQKKVDLLEKDYEIVAIDEMRGAKNHLFTIAWDKSYRTFFEKYWNLIDFEGSFGGDSSREARKAQFFGRTLEQSGEAEPGKRFMRRFADTGAKDIGKFFAFGSAFDMVDNFGAVFNRVKRWSHVMQNGDKLRGTFMTMLNDPALLADPVKFTTEIKKNYRPHMSTDDTFDREYYSDEEYFLASQNLENQLDYVTGQWAEAIIEYNKEHTWQQHAADLRQEVLTKNVASMVAHELITPHRASHILDNQFGPLPKRILYDITHVLMRPKEGFIGLIMELLEESGKAWSAGLK